MATNPIHIINGVFAVSRECLCALVPVGTVDYHVNKGKLSAVNHGYYAFADMPVQWQEAYCRLYFDGKTPEMYWYEAQISVALDGVRKKHYTANDYTYFVNKGISMAHAKDYAIGASWLRLLNSYNSRSSIAALNLPNIVTKADLREAVVYALNQNKLSKFVAGTARVMQVKEMAFAKEGINSLISKKIGNTNTLKLTDEVKKLILGIYVGTGRAKKLAAQVYYEYLNLVQKKVEYVEPETGEVFGLASYPYPELSLRSVTGLLTQPETVAITAKLVHGNKYYNDFVLPYVHGKKPKYSLSMTTSDGEVSPFPLLDRKGNVTFKRPVSYLIFDVCSQAIIGFAMANAESLDLMKFAFRNMLMRTGGVVGIENQLDNFGKGFQSTLQDMFKYVSFGKPYSPQSKYAETYIGRFEQQCLRLDDAFVGGNIQDKKQVNKVNPDTVRIGYDIETQYDKYLYYINLWNNSVAQSSGGTKTRWEVFQENINPECKRMSLQEIAHCVGERRIEQIFRGSITLVLNKQKYEFQIGEKEYEAILPILKNEWNVAVRFVPEDMSQIFLYNYVATDKPEGDNYIGTAYSWEYMQRAKAEQSNKDLGILGKQHRHIEAIDKGLQEKAAQIPRLMPISQDIELKGNDAELIAVSGYTVKADMQAAETALVMNETEIKDTNEVVNAEPVLNINPRFKRFLNK